MVGLTQIGLAVVLGEVFLVLPPSASDDVLVRAPLVRLVRRAEIATTCGPAGSAYACTAFVGRRLDSGCALFSRGWTMFVRVQLIPVIDVDGAVWQRHELDHVADVRHRIRLFVSTLSATPFPSLEECEGAARRAVSSFDEVVDDVLLQSNAPLRGA